MNSLINRSVKSCFFAALCAVAGITLAAPVEYSAGHADIGLAYEAGELDLRYVFGTNALDGSLAGGVFSSSDVYIRVADSTKPVGGVPGPVPFLGLDTGDDVWILPPNNTPGVPFLGIATEDLSAPFSSATLEMTGMAGPGNFALWQQVGFTTSVLMRSNDGIGGSGDTLTIPSIGSHDHYNFGFTEAGIYDITFEATAFNPDLPGGFATDTETFRFVVGDLTAIPEPSSFAAVTFFAAAGLLVRRRRKSKSTLQST